MSIIVCVWQAEETLPRSLDSLLNQTFKDWECILVDDGATDGSGELCDKYAKEDVRFHTIHKLTNGGVSEARQTGLENSRGKYVIHVDPDDYVAPDYLQKLYEKGEIEHADIVVCDYYEEYYGSERPIAVRQYINVETDYSTFRYFIMLSNGVLWNKLISKDIIIRSQARFPRGRFRFAEDLVFLAQVLIHSPKVAHVSVPLYHYTLGFKPNQLSRSETTMFEGLEKAYKLIIPMISSQAPLLAEELKFNLKYRAYADMVPWQHYHNCYSEINHNLKKNFGQKRINALIIYYTANNRCLYEIVLILRKVKRLWKRRK